MNGYRLRNRHGITTVVQPTALQTALNTFHLWQPVDHLPYAWYPFDPANWEFVEIVTDQNQNRPTDVPCRQFWQGPYSGGTGGGSDYHGSSSW